MLRILPIRLGETHRGPKRFGLGLIPGRIIHRRSPEHATSGFRKVKNSHDPPPCGSTHPKALLHELHGSARMKRPAKKGQGAKSAKVEMWVCRCRLLTGQFKGVARRIQPIGCWSANRCATLILFDAYPFPDPVLFLVVRPAVLVPRVIERQWRVRAV